MAVIFVQLAQAQLPPLPTIPPITIPPITIPPLPLPALPVVPAGPPTCPAGYFGDLVSMACYPCPAGSTSTAGVVCFVCPVGTYAPGAGSAQCYPCSKGYSSTPAGEACMSDTLCTPAKDSKAGSTGGASSGKRSLREEIEEEVEAESMFSF